MIRYVLTTRTVGDIGAELAAAFRNACLALLGLGIFAGLGHGPWAGEFVLAVLLAVLLVGITTGVLYLAARWAFSAAWSSVQSDARRTTATTTDGRTPCSS